MHLDTELRKDLESLMLRAEALKELPKRSQGQEPWNPKSIFEWRLRQLDSIAEQIQYIRGKVIVEYRGLPIPK